METTTYPDGWWQAYRNGERLHPRTRDLFIQAFGRDALPGTTAHTSPVSERTWREWARRGLVEDRGMWMLTKLGYSMM